MVHTLTKRAGKELREAAGAFLVGEISRQQLIEEAAKRGHSVDSLDLLVASVARGKTASLTAVEKNKILYRRFIQEVFNEGRLDNLDSFLSPSYVYRDAPAGTPAGTDGIRQVVSMFRMAFPDLHISIEHQVAEEEYVCSRTTTRGTHKGTIFGISPTDRAVTVYGLTMVRITDGRLMESWVKNDVMGLMRQLGAL